MRVSRDAEGVPCECGGYADRVATTEDERKIHGCERDERFGWECCSRAFICRVCKTRIACTAAAPEMD